MPVLQYNRGNTHLCNEITQPMPEVTQQRVPVLQYNRENTHLCNEITQQMRKLRSNAYQCCSITGKTRTYTIKSAAKVQSCATKQAGGCSYSQRFTASSVFVGSVLKIILDSGAFACTTLITCSNSIKFEVWLLIPFPITIPL